MAGDSDLRQKFVKKFYNLSINTLGTKGFFLACDGELRFVGRRPTRVLPKAEDMSGEMGHFLRLDRNRKPLMKSLWHHQGY